MNKNNFYKFLVIGIICAISCTKKPSICDCEKTTNDLIRGELGSAEKFLKCMDYYGDDVKKDVGERLNGTEMSGLKNGEYQVSEFDYQLYFSEKCK